MICSNCQKEIGSAAICPYCHTEQQPAQPYYLSCGTVIGSKYTIRSILGEGGFGITYLGRDTFFERDVAVKEYYPHGFSYRNTESSNEVSVSPVNARDFYEHGKKRFLSEGKVLVKFNTEPGVVSVIDYVAENNTAYLVMEYLEGVTLQHYLKQHGRLSAEEAFDMLAPVMHTLEKIHAAGVIHRDISPDNIMRLKSGQLKLMDFGAAKEYLDENRSMSVMLKKGYAPEEQYRRNGKQGPWTDVYALCATVYRCITGRAPDESLDRLAEDTLQKPSSLGADISPALEDVLLYGLAVRQKDRCQNMTELLERLEQAKAAAGTANESTAVTADIPDNETAFLVTEPLPEETDSNSAGTAADKIHEDPDATVLAYETVEGSGETIIADNLEAADGQTNMTKPIAAGLSDASSADQNSTKNTPKKRKKALLIAVIAAILVVAIIAGIVVLNRGKSAKSDSGRSSDNKFFDSVPYDGSQWTNIADVSSGGSHIVGLKNDGTVVAFGNSRYCADVESWTDILDAEAGEVYTVGLKKNGTVVASGNTNGFDFGSWTDITAISAGAYHIVGIRSDGSVVATGRNENGECDVESWTDIKAVAAGYQYTVGLKNDGTVVAVGSNNEDQCDVSDWDDIVALAAGYYHTVGLKKDGTVVATGRNDHGQCDVGDWKDIVAIASNYWHTVGLKKDGTVTTVGYDKEGQNNVGDWTDIVAISAGARNTVGLKSDGTIVEAGKEPSMTTD